MRVSGRDVGVPGQHALIVHRLADGDAAQPVEACRKRFGKTLGHVLCDQDAGPRGVFVNFFGSPASTFKSIALLALEYDALIMVGYSIRRPAGRGHQFWSKFEVGCEAVIDPRNLTSQDPVGEITQLYTLALERAIRRAPEQYFWVHRRWKSEPKKRKNEADKTQQRLAG